MHIILYYIDLSIHFALRSWNKSGGPGYVGTGAILYYDILLLYNITL